MSVIEAIVFFVITWWLVLFTTLPFGVRRMENPEPGMEAGAPEKPRLVAKALVTTAIAGVLTGAVHLAAETGMLPIREWLTADSYATAR